MEECGGQEQQKHNDSPRYGRIIVVQLEDILVLGSSILSDGEIHVVVILQSEEERPR